MYPSAIREQILSLYERLENELDELESLARTLRENGRQLEETRLQARRVDGTLVELIEQETELLQPALRSADAWGDVRVEQLLDNHQLHHDTIDRLREEFLAGRVDVPQLADGLLQIVSQVRQALGRGRRRFLHPDLLRDDVVAVAQSDG